MKQKRYTRMKKRILMGASGAVIAGMMFMGTSTAWADTATADAPLHSQTPSTGAKGMHLMRRWNSSGRAGNLAASLGLDENEVKAELKSGKPLKQILQEHGIVPDQLQKAFTKVKHSKNK